MSENHPGDINDLIAKWNLELAGFTVSLQVRWLALRSLPPDEVMAELDLISREARLAYHRYHHIDLDTSRWIAELGDSARKRLVEVRANARRRQFQVVTNQKSRKEG